jgi:hypothetical protein
MLVTADHPPPQKQNKTTAKWKQKLANRSGIMDTDYTSGAGAKHNVDCLQHQPPIWKSLHATNKTQIKATNKMMLKHNLWPGASKVKIVPNLNSTLISTQNGQCQLCYGV